MSQTGLRLNWAEEFQHLACIYSLRSFGCSWWFPVDPQRLNCSGFGPCLPWTRRAWCSGAWLPQLGLSVKSSCDTQDWVIPSVRIGRGIGVVTKWLEGLRWNVRTCCVLGLNHHINYMKKRGFDRKFHFSQLFTPLAKAYEIIMQNSFWDQEMTNTCLSQLNHTLVPPLPHQGPTLHCKFDNWVQHQVKLWVWQWANQSSMGVKQTAFPQRAQSHRGDSGLVASPI